MSCGYVCRHLSRHRERPLVDAFDMARLRLQAPVRRPSSRNVEPRNLLRIHDSLQLKYTGIIICLTLFSCAPCRSTLLALNVCMSGGESRLGFSEVPKLEEVGVSSGRRWDYREPYDQASSQRSTVQDGQNSLKILQHLQCGWFLWGWMLYLDSAIRYCTWC